MNVNRATLREILLTGLGDSVHFGRRLTNFTERADGVTLRFENAPTEADVVIGADGIRSPVRSKRAPHAEIQDSGVRAIYGRIPFPGAVTCVPQQAREDVFTVAVDERQCFFGLGSVIFPRRPEQAAASVPLARLSPQEDYVVCIVGGRQELLRRHDASRAALRVIARPCSNVLASWPSSTRAILDHADPASFFAVEMSTSIPTTLHPGARSTLLGDAIHAMTPTLGRGGNVAMRDAALLARHLAAVDARSASKRFKHRRSRFAKRKSPIDQSWAVIEARLELAYGFDVVRAAAAMGTRLMGQRPLP